MRLKDTASQWRPRVAGVLPAARAAALTWGLTVSILFGLFSPHLSDAADSRVDQVKAAFVLNIIRFVAWPAESFRDPAAPLLLCLSRSNPHGRAMLELEGQIASDRAVSVRTISALADSQNCQILLIDDSELAEYSTETPIQAARPLLTILDMTEREQTEITRPNVMISLVRKATRMGFEINLDKVRQAGLRMSSELLKLATIVENGG